MRKGKNPNKIKNEQNTLKLHRVIIVVHIPNIIEDYYKELPLVLDKSLESLVKSINIKTTNITLIDNASCFEAKEILEKYKIFIDKIVYFNENKGKVYALLNEVRGVYEPYVTLTDSDVIFSKDWETIILNSIINDDNIGCITPIPMPQLSFYHNTNFIFNYFFKKSFKKTKVISDIEFDRMVSNFNKTKNDFIGKMDWNKTQYQYKNNNYLIAGSGHFCAIYNTNILKKSNDFPSLKFSDGYEEHFIDKIIDKYGYYRLSTTKNLVYHMGNKFEKDFSFFNYTFENIISVKVKKKLTVIYFIRIIFAKIFKKYLFNF